MTVAKNIANSPRSAAFKLRIATKYAIAKRCGKTFIHYSFDDGSRLMAQRCTRNLNAVQIYIK